MYVFIEQALNSNLWAYVRLLPESEESFTDMCGSTAGGASAALDASFVLCGG